MERYPFYRCVMRQVQLVTTTARWCFWFQIFLCTVGWRELYEGREAAEGIALNAPMEMWWLRACGLAAHLIKTFPAAAARADKTASVYSWCLTWATPPVCCVMRVFAEGQRAVEQVSWQLLSFEQLLALCSPLSAASASWMERPAGGALHVEEYLGRGGGVCKPPCREKSGAVAVGVTCITGLLGCKAGKVCVLPFRYRRWKKWFQALVGNLGRNRMFCSLFCRQSVSLN